MDPSGILGNSSLPLTVSLSAHLRELAYVRRNPIEGRKPTFAQLSRPAGPSSTIKIGGSYAHNANGMNGLGTLKSSLDPRVEISKKKKLTASNIMIAVHKRTIIVLVEQNIKCYLPCRYSSVPNKKRTAPIKSVLHVKLSVKQLSVLYQNVLFINKLQGTFHTIFSIKPYFLLIEM